MSNKARAHDDPHVVGLLERLRLHRTVASSDSRTVKAGYVFLGSFISIALLAVVAAITGSPFVFPSLGPTAYLFFFKPMTDAASPRNTIISHAIALVCGYLAFKIGGSHPFVAALQADAIGWRQAVAPALSLALTGAFMVLFRIDHPPAGATTMIVSLGIVATPSSLVTIEAAVILLTLQAFCLHRFAGVPFPIWHAPDSPAKA